VLTGDTLFIGDVGRPDLSKTHTSRQLADCSTTACTKKLLALPDVVRCIPRTVQVRCADAPCRAERSSTIGTERLTNYALQIASREEFIAS